MLHHETKHRSPQALQVTVNGQSMEFAAPLTVHQLLAHLGRPPAGLAVEINEVLIPRAEHDQKLLQNGDRVEVVSLVGGG